MSDCRFGVSPVNYPDPDPDPHCYLFLLSVFILWFIYYVSDHLFGKELFIRFTSSAFCKLPSIYVFSYFSFGFEGRMWDLIVSVPDHCLSFYFSY